MVVETARRTSTVPVVLTRMLGREDAIVGLRALMRDPAARLITITGPGGVGKTRLAIAAVPGADDDLDVVFVPLAAIRDRERIAPAIGQAIGLNLEPVAEGETALFSALGERPTILVLDNLEQIPGAGEVLGRLVAHTPGLTVLATSQVVLGVPGERVFPLAPLRVPGDGEGDARASDAVALFMERARAVDPGLDESEGTLAAAADICRRLDGLPLAIELAAARANVLSPHALRERLDDRLGLLGTHRDDVDARHRTLRAAIAWTYDMLDPVEQALFRHLSVFTGGISLDAAQSVFDERDDRTVREVLESLVRRNLLQPTPVKDGAERYLMLESLREFGVGQLIALGEEDDARRAHARFAVSLAEEAEPHLWDHQQETWFMRLDAELENLRASVAWSLESDRRDLVLRIAGPLWPFLRERGLITDCRAWLLRALGDTGSVAAPYRAKALVAAGNLAHDHRDLDASMAYFEQALHLAMATGDTVQEINALYGLGRVSDGKAQFAKANELGERGLQLASQINHRRLMAVGEATLGTTAYYQGRFRDAIRYWDAAACVLRELGDASGEALMLSNIGGASILLDDLVLAEESTRRAIGMQRQLRTRTRLLSSLNNLGLIYLQQGKMADARAVLMDALAMHREDGNVSGQSHVTNSLANVELEDGNVKGAASWFLESLRLRMETDDVSGIIHFAQLLISICTAHGDHRNAVLLLAAESRLRHDMQYELSDYGRHHLDMATAAARSSLDEETFIQGWSRGSAMTLAEVLQRMPVIARQIVGRQVLDPGIARQVAPTPVSERDVPDYGLTSRELEILHLLGAGTSTQDIATALAISPRTVATHIGNIMAKLDVTSRTAAVALAMREGVLPADD